MENGLIILQNVPLITIEQLGQSILVTAASAAIYILWIELMGPLAETPATVFYALVSMLTAYVGYVTEIVSQIHSFPPDVIFNRPMNEIVNMLGFLTPLIKNHEMIFYLLVRIVNFLESINSPLFDDLDEIFEQMREQGNYLLEVYRALEARAGIDIAHSAISLQDYET